MRRLTAGFCSVAFLAGCSTYVEEIPALDAASRNLVEDLRIEIAQGDPGRAFGAVAVGSPGQAALDYLDGLGGFSSCPGCSGEAALLNVGFILATAAVGAPIAAIIAAIETERPEDVKKATGEILPVINSDAWSARVASRLTETIRGSRLKILGGDAETTSFLRLTVDGPFLDIDGTGAVPFVVVHGELQNGGTCFADRYWRWNGDEDNYLDFGDDHAKMLKAQLETGAGKLGEAIAADLFLSDKPRQVSVPKTERTNRVQVPIMVLEPHSYENEIASWHGPTEKFGPDIPCFSETTAPTPEDMPPEDMLPEDRPHEERNYHSSVG